MPKLNRQLITSIIQDIQESSTVADEMCSWIGRVEHLSWRFPTRFARNVNALGIVKRHKGSAGEMYILLLEMAYDRVHFVLRLVVEFVDSYPFVGDLFKEVTKVAMPRSMSLANIIRILWDRLKLIPETVTRNMIKTKHLGDSVLDSSTSRGCQASGSLFSCESCSNAAKAIKDLTSILSAALKENKLPSVIVAERKVIRSDIFEKTQWAVMTRLVEAIDADVKTLLKTTSEIRSESEASFKEHEKSLQSLVSEFEKERTDKNSMEMKISEMTNRMHAVDSHLQMLKDTNLELVEENRRLTEYIFEAKEKSSNLEILLAVFMRQGAEVSESKLALENAVKYLRQEVTKAQQASIIETEKLRENMDHLREENVSLKKQHHEELQSLREKQTEVVEKFHENARFVRVDAFSTKKETETEEVVRFAENPVPNGDPEIDMTEQLTANKKAIEELTRQNERLSRTLARLRDHRRISETGTIAVKNGD